MLFLWLGIATLAASTTKAGFNIDLTNKFHNDLPERIRLHLNARGIPDAIIDRHLLGWNSWRITIPIFNREGNLAFFKQAKDPEDKSDSPKMIAWREALLSFTAVSILRRNPLRS